MVWRNTRYTKRDPNCTNVVAATGTKPEGDHWVKATRIVLDGLTQLYRQGDTRYFGHL